MKPLHTVFPELLNEVAKYENIMCEGQALANPLYYLPISGPGSIGGSNYYGYHFFVVVEGKPEPRVANVMVDPDNRLLEVTIGEGQSFNPQTALANGPRHVKRPDLIFLQEGTLVPSRGLEHALTNEEGEDIALKFVFPLEGVVDAAEFVVEFLLSRRQPHRIKYL